MSEIEDIELPQALGETISVIVVQTKSLFRDEVDRGWQGNNLSLVIRDDAKSKYAARIEKIKSILTWTRKEFSTVNVILFPEYGFIYEDRAFDTDKKGTYQTLVDFSRESGVIVVGNFYSQEKRQSISFVLAPITRDDGQRDCKEYLMPKVTQTADEDAFVNSKVEDGAGPSKSFRFWWNPTGDNPAYLQVFTCKDYLFYTSVGPLRKYPEMIDVEHPGIILAPLCTSEIQTFESRATAMLRDVPSVGNDGALVTLFANATSIPGVEGPLFAGRSQIVSPIDFKSDVRPIIERNVEGIIWAEINPFRAMRKPTQTDIRTSNKALVKSRVLNFRFDSGNQLREIEEASYESRNRGYTLNPEVLLLNENYKYYGFLRIRDYPRFKHNLRQRQKAFPLLSLDIHGVFGLHDILVSFYEGVSNLNVGRDLLRARLWPTITDDVDFDNEHMALCRVTKVFKHRGVLLKDFPVHPGSAELASLSHVVQTISGLFSNGDVNGALANDDMVNRLKSANVLINTKFESSDLLDQERNEGKTEFLVVVRVHQGDFGPKADGAKERFEAGVLQSLLRDSRVRTIESIESDQRGYFDGDYLLHMVGHLTDLIEVVVGVLQSEQVVGAKDVLTTRVILSAETLSKGRMRSLLEPRKVPTSLSPMLDLMKAWTNLEGDQARRIGEIVPTVVLLLPDDYARRFVQALYLAQFYANGDKDWERSFYQFSYASAVSLVGSQIGMEMPYEQFKELSRSFILRVGSCIEALLNTAMRSVFLSIKIEGKLLSDLCNEAIAVVKKDRGTIDASKLMLGNVERLLEAFHGCTQEKYKMQWHKASVTAIKQSLPDRDDAYRDNVFDKWINLVEKLKPTGDEIGEFKRFVIARNQMAHDVAENERMSAKNIFLGAFEGIRVYDKLMIALRA